MSFIKKYYKCYGYVILIQFIYIYMNIIYVYNTICLLYVDIRCYIPIY